VLVIFKGIVSRADYFSESCIIINYIRNFSHVCMRASNLKKNWISLCSEILNLTIVSLHINPITTNSENPH
jgi:hypothetical protein